MKVFNSKFADFKFRTVYITDNEEAEELITTEMLGHSLYGLDTEGSKKLEFKDHEQAGLDPYLTDIRLIQIYCGNTCYVFDLKHVDISVLKFLFYAGRFVAHFGMYEVKMLTHAGYPNMNVGCSLLMSRLIDCAEFSKYEPEEEIDDSEDQTGLSRYRAKSHSLDAVVQRLFGVKVDKMQQTSDWSAEVLSEEQILYASLDSVLTYHVAKKLEVKIKEYKMGKYYQLIKDIQHVVASMELAGLPVDWEYHAELMKKWKVNSEKSLEVCKPFFGDVNMRSGKQMSQWLVAYLKDDPKTLAAWPKTDKGSHAFGRPVLGDFNHLPPIAALLEYKKWSKLLDTYGESLVEKKHPVTGRLHTSYTLAQTATGRFSSRNPNVQNMPRDKEFRNMFKAPEGHVLVVSDFSQIELRLQAEFSQDPTMLGWYKNKQDAYKSMASSLFRVPVASITKEQRFVGKVMLLALGYGMGYTKLGTYSKNAGVKHPDKFWAAAHQRYHETVSTYSDWCYLMRDRATDLGYIETLLGKRRKLGEKEVFTGAPNTIIQGTASELMMKALLICQGKVKDLGTIVATVHDEILICTPVALSDKVAELLADSMNQAMVELFPHAADHHVADAAFGSRWGDAKSEL